MIRKGAEDGIQRETNPCQKWEFGYLCNQEQIPFPMNHTKETTSQEYQSPASRIIPLNVENAICDSTLPGGNEDIGFEDWD